MSDLEEQYTREEIVVSFPVGHWEVEKILKKNPKKDNKEKEFDLDEYLKKNKGKGRMINANITKVGD